MTIKIRTFHWENDFELVRHFLVETSKSTPSFQNWIPSRFENIKFGPCGVEYKDEDDKNISIWEEIDESQGISSSKIVAATIHSPPIHHWIQIHPEYRSLEKSIVLWIEEQRKGMRSTENQALELQFFVEDNNEERITLLSDLDYQKLELCEYNRKRSLNSSIPDYELPTGFSIRNVDVEADYLQYRTVQAAVFPHCRNLTEKMLKLYSSTSFYNKELDLVVIAPNGIFTAFCTVRLDPISRIAELEPVGTHPNYRNRGLAKAVICEGLHRVQKYKPSLICILGAAPTEAANRLYDSLGFTEKIDVYSWKKIV